MTRMRSLGLLFRLALLVFVFAAAFFYRDDIGRALWSVADLKPFVLLAIPLFLFWNWIASLGWLELHRALTVGKAPSGWKMSWIRLQAQAVNLVLPLATVGGDVLRTTIVSRKNGQFAGTASAVVLDKISDITAGVVFSVFGLLIGLGQLENSGRAVMISIGLLVLSLAGLPLALHAAASRISQAESKVARALAPIREAPTKVSMAFYRAIAWHLGERVLGAGEIYLAMSASGLALGATDTLFVTAVMTAYSLVFFFIPGQLGAIEAGIVSAFVTLGLPPTAGLTVALVRRARQLLLIAGGTALVLVGGRESPEPEVDTCD